MSHGRSPTSLLHTPAVGGLSRWRQGPVGRWNAAGPPTGARRCRPTDRAPICRRCPVGRCPPARLCSPTQPEPRHGGATSRQPGRPPCVKLRTGQSSNHVGGCIPLASIREPVRQPSGVLPVHACSGRGLRFKPGLRLARPRGARCLCVRLRVGVDPAPPGISTRLRRLLHGLET